MLGEESPTELQSSGCLNTAIIIPTTCGIVKDADNNLLSENGGHINLTKDWAKYLRIMLRGVIVQLLKVSADNFAHIKA